ncbi:glutamate 5-kinase [Acidihalobacter yilgarnensis]|uniref:Glutamate 5-kinase n=1 Tax=Acidihalobacter yilgarnensis TaxID=2819280 RepID=A0A1D8ISA2_9GAMM|nr:glutamate 5-kinase [Acidihalobacter yilgarnensis]AOU99346.1 glutamate 5-kinase [Acidihalobacter yilgarnensis]
MKTPEPTRGYRWVVKIGSSLLTADGRGLDHAALADWADQIAQLRNDGKQIVLVSSGAVAEGMNRLGWKSRPSALHQLQAAAAVGQMGLIQAYQDQFSRQGLLAAQVLLTHDDLVDRRRYLNARSTLRALLALGAIPIVNENDTVAADEIRFGDNDTLGALVANLVEADLLVILTDQRGLFDRDPRQHADATLIAEAQASDPCLQGYAASGVGSLGRGGMATKVSAARRAARSGAATIISAGREPDVLLRLAAGERLGTLLRPDKEPLAARKQWIASQLKLHGEVWVDVGAANALCAAGRSLLPVGVTEVRGKFARGEVVSVRNTEGQEIARGLINYDAAETRRIMRLPSESIEPTLGYVDEPELIHRDNLVLI